MLGDHVSLEDPSLIKQWSKVLRYAPGREVCLFNSQQQEAVYRIQRISKKTVDLEKVTDLESNLPNKDVYLCFSLLKKDKNEWVLQKATELGVSYFVPIISARTEKTGWNEERAEKIVIEAAEQCGRTDIPGIMSPTKLEMMKESFPKGVSLYVAEQSSSKKIINMIHQKEKDPIAILIGPEGGWTDGEKKYFSENDIEAISFSEFTLRAETAAITAVVRLL